MRAKARGLLLFGFAFSSVLSSSEVLKLPSNVKEITGNDTKLEKREINLGTREMKPRQEKREAEVFPQGEKKEMFDALQDLGHLQGLGSLPQQPDKRARVGFTGMRGKKEFSADDYCTRLLRTSPYLNKRFLRDYGELLEGKRAPVAFHGMRGKKSEDYEDEGADFRVQAFLKESGLLEEPDVGLQEAGSEEGTGFGKRSPYTFQGMRGKKETDVDLKRAMGFLGMKGKRVMEVWNTDASYKRAPQTSFFGMKGKKAQSSGFFGMRGKKALPNTFYGIKGKREPLDYDSEDFSTSNETRESSEERTARFRRAIAWLNNSKKAKNFFFGMRGKKSTDEKSDSRLSSTFK